MAKVNELQVHGTNDLMNLKSRVASDTQLEAKGPLLISANPQHFKGKNQPIKGGNHESFVAKEVEIASDMEASVTVAEIDLEMFVAKEEETASGINAFIPMSVAGRDVRDTEVHGPGLHTEEGRTGDTVNSSSTLQLPKSMAKLNEMLSETGLKETFQWRTQRGQESDGIPPNELRLVIIGKSGNGKSSTANTIIGKDICKTGASATSITKETETYRASRFGKEILLVDTPGFFDPEIERKETEKEISRCMYETLPGFHAFLLVVRIGRFTTEEVNTVKEFEKLFGEKLYDFMIIVFTQMDALTREKKTLNDFVLGPIPTNLKEIIERCNHRYVGFNNIGNQKSKNKNTKKVLGIIETMIYSKDPNHYTNDAFKKAEKELCEKIEAETERMKAAKKADFEEMFAEREKKMREEHAINISEMKEMYAKLMADHEKSCLELKKSLNYGRELRQKEHENYAKEMEKDNDLCANRRSQLMSDYMKEMRQKEHKEEMEKENELNKTLITKERKRMEAELEQQIAEEARRDAKRDKSAWFRFGKWIGFWKE